jgi:GNAT superfamily N-acetyltransferase
MPKPVEPSWRDGLRGVQAEDFGSLVRLLHTVFWDGLVPRYPHCYALDNAENLRVIVEDGEVVSHIGTIRRNVSIFGCTVRVASLGGVATYEEHRGRGHATRLFEDNVQQCRQDGCDFMLVSGYRKMYHRFGCRYVGRDWSFAIPREHADAFDDAGIEIVEATPDDIETMAEIYRHEPVRWLRPRADYENGMKGFVTNKPAEFLLVRENGAVRGYVIVVMARRERDAGTISLAELAGERRAVAGALGKILRRHDDAGRLGVHVMRCDARMRGLLEAGGLEGTPANSSGTTMIINFRQFMERMRPYFEERVGTEAAESLVFIERAEQMIFAYGGDEVVAEDAGQAIQIIFGTLDGAEEALLEAGGRAGKLLRQLFPLQGLWYGLNYV